MQLDQISKKAVPGMGAISVCRDSHPPAPISCMTQAKMSVRSHSWFQVGCVAQRLLGGVGKPAPVRERGRKPRRTAASSAASHLLHDLMSILSCGERALWDTPPVPAPCAAPMVCRCGDFPTPSLPVKFKFTFLCPKLRQDEQNRQHVDGQQSVGRPRCTRLPRVNGSVRQYPGNHGTGRAGVTNRQL